MADTAVTIARNRVSELSADETGNWGYSVKFNVQYTDIAYGTGSTDTVTMTLGSTPTNWYVDKAGVNVSTAFAGTTALTVTVGTTTTTNAFVTAQSVLTQGWLAGASGLPVQTNANGSSSLGLRATFTNATGGSPSALTAGNANIYLRLTDLSKAP